MKATTQRKQFIQALRSVTAQVGRDVPALKWNVVSIEASDRGELLLSGAKDYDQLIKIRLGATDVDSGAIYVNARRLLRLVKMTWGDDLTLWQEEKYRIKISDGRVTYSIENYAAEKTAIANMGEQKFESQLAVPRLLELSRQVLHAASCDESRSTLTCVSFNGRVVATDGFQISMVDESVEGLHGLIPAKFLAAAMRVLENDEIIAEINEERIALSDGTATLEGPFFNRKRMNFPDIDPIIPKNPKMVVSMSTADLRMALFSALAIGHAGVYPVVRFKFMGDKVSITAKVENSEIETTLPVSIICESTEINLPFNIGFNADYLLKNIQHADDRVRMLITANNRPVLIKPDEESAWQGVLMPII